jgi:hypothetical protein
MQERIALQERFARKFPEPLLGFAEALECVRVAFGAPNVIVSSQIWLRGGESRLTFSSYGYAPY